MLLSLLIRLKELTSYQEVIIKNNNCWDTWDRISAWSSDARDVPREVAALRTLNAQPSEGEAVDPAQQLILGYEGFRLDKRLRFYRVASLEANLGDLTDVLDSFDPNNRYFRQKNEERLRRDPTFDDQTPEMTDFNDPSYEWLPLHFIWRTFGAIVQGLTYMHKHGIVHRDLKPDNIFMMKDDNTQSIMRPWGCRPIIADLGGAMPKAPRRYENPADFDACMTVPNAAPEQYNTVPPMIEDRTNPEFGYPMDEKADVFGAACTVWG